MDLIYDGIYYFYLKRLGLNNALYVGNSDLNAQSSNIKPWMFNEGFLISTLQWEW